MSVFVLLSNKTPSTLLNTGLFVSTVIAVRLVHQANVLSPMLVTLLGIVTLVRLVQRKNAMCPMLVTGILSMVSGMVTAPPEPVYLVMVIVPLFVV